MADLSFRERAAIAFATRPDLARVLGSGTQEYVYAGSEAAVGLAERLAEACCWAWGCVHPDGRRFQGESTSVSWRCARCGCGRNVAIDNCPEARRTDE